MEFLQKLFASSGAFSYVFLALSLLGQAVFVLKLLQYFRAKHDKSFTSWARYIWGQGLFSLLATLSPLIGLLGTVAGLFESFQVMASGNRELIATHMSTALSTTILGLILAMVFHVEGFLLRGLIPLEISHMGDPDEAP